MRKKRRRRIFTIPPPPFTSRTDAKASTSAGLPVTSTAAPISRPRKRDPASPISTRDGSAFHQR